MLNEEPNGGLVAARTAAAFAAEDEQRREWLDWVIKRGGTCRRCGATVSDAGLQVHPGVCGSCFSHGRATPLKPPAEITQPPAAAPASAPSAPPPETETAMPRGMPTTKRTCCESRGGRHLASCSLHGKPSPPAVPKPRSALRAPSALRSTDALGDGSTFDVQSASIEQLVGTIAACRAELADRRQELQAQLEQVAEAIGSAA